MAQSVKCPTSARVMVSRFMSSSPTSGSVPPAQSLEPASDSVSPSLSAPPLLMLCVSLSLKINKHKIFFFNAVSNYGHLLSSWGLGLQRRNLGDTVQPITDIMRIQGTSAFLKGPWEGKRESMC